MGVGFEGEKRKTLVNIPNVGSFSNLACLLFCDTSEIFSPLKVLCPVSVAPLPLQVHAC